MTDDQHPTTSSELHLALALDGAGWHPGAWREPDARPSELFTAPYWLELVRRAEEAQVDFVTIEDAMGMQSSGREVDGRTDQVRGRLDAVLVASRVAPMTRAIGLVPTATTTHTEPFHVSKAIATLDFVSSGRAGWRAQVSLRWNEARHFGRRFPAAVPPLGPDGAAARFVPTGLLEEAADFVQVVRRLWDSWEDDAEIRDVETGRFVDVGKLHPVDFEGRWFRVHGPSITPRPPQGQPPVAVLAHGPEGFRLAVREADVVFVAPRDRDEAGRLVETVRVREAAAGRHERLRIFADLVVCADPSAAVAMGRRDRMDELDGEPWRCDAQIFAGSVSALADLVEEWAATGLDGFRLRPAALPHDLGTIATGLVPELQRRGRFRARYREQGLRARLGLARPQNRYAA